MAFSRVIIYHQKPVHFCRCIQNIVFYSFENVKICTRKSHFVGKFNNFYHLKKMAVESSTNIKTYGEYALIKKLMDDGLNILKVMILM